MESSRAKKAKIGRLLSKSESAVEVDLQALKPLTTAASVRDVRFIGFSAGAAPEILNVVEHGFCQRILYKAELLNDDGDAPPPLVVYLDFKYEALCQKKVVCKISTEMLAFYSIPEEVLSHSSLAQRRLFARTNGLYSCWPYLREFVASSAARLGLPRIALPVWRIPKVLPPEGQFSTMELHASATK